MKHQYTPTRSSMKADRMMKTLKEVFHQRWWYPKKKFSKSWWIYWNYWWGSNYIWLLDLWKSLYWSSCGFILIYFKYVGYLLVTWFQWVYTRKFLECYESPLSLIQFLHISWLLVTMSCADTWSFKSDDEWRPYRFRWKFFKVLWSVSWEDAQKFFCVSHWEIWWSVCGTHTFLL